MVSPGQVLSIVVSNVVEFTEEAVKEHLDDCIRFWREREKKARFGPLSRNDPGAAREAAHQEDMAKHYIDAYQSVRSSLFGELLP